MCYAPISELVSPSADLSFLGEARAHDAMHEHFYS